MKKLIIIIISAVAVCGIVLFLVLGNKDISGVSKNAIGETDITKKAYGYPVISLISYNSNKIYIDAGYFRFGDVNLDAVVDDQDIEEIDTMISTKLFYTNEQRLLADVDESGAVNRADIDLFKLYFKKNGAVKYDLRKDTLEYCLTKTKDSSTCVWQKSNTFTVKEARDYYGFVRQKNTLVISDSQIFKKEGFEDASNKTI